MNTIKHSNSTYSYKLYLIVTSKKNYEIFNFGCLWGKVLSLKAYSI